ncbi:MAG: aspartate aminotransferase family protein, partial [Moorea sp. SIO3E2]|nr:aspartate aminotransferase family protein [Moorena sp. SIO3E2]
MTEINQGSSKTAEEWCGNSTEMSLHQGIKINSVLDKERLDSPTTIDSQALREIDQEYLCWGDTVHYQERPIIVTGCKGGLVFDDEGKSYIDTGMWHSSCNFGYRNPE